MSDVTHSITDTIGLTDYAGAEDARTEAKVAGERSYKLTEEQLDFQKEQYGDWKDIYGTLQEDIAESINLYSGEGDTVRRLALQNREKQMAKINIEAQMAQRGMEGSGLETAALTSLEMGSAANRAKIRSEQDELDLQKKMGFLGIGLGQGAQMLGTQANVANVGAQIAGNLAGQNIQQETALKQASLSNMGGIMKSGIGAGGNVMAAAASDERLKTNIKKVDVSNGMNIYTWDWNETAKELGIDGPTKGVMAQEVMEIFPEAVSKDKNGYYQIDYEQLGVEL